MNQEPTSVLIIVENLPVPFDRRVWQEARALSEASYRVSVICPRGSGFEASRETRDGIEIYRHRTWEASGPLGYLLEYGWALLMEFALAVRVYARTRFRILHACNPPDTIFLIGLFFKLFGVRFIFDHHDLSPELFEAKFNRKGLFYQLVCWAEWLTFRTADVSIATNESYRDIAVTRGGMNAERVFIVRSCPDIRNTGQRPPKPGLKEDRSLLVVYLGVMGVQEGLDLLLESIEYIVKKQNRRDAFFVFIGAGTELPRLRAVAAEKGLASITKFTGRIHDDELTDYLCTADVCVAPDPYNPLNDKSTMNKILEYMAYGRPIVLYDLSEGRRSARDAALYARPNDPKDFAEKIIKLLDSEALRRQLGNRGRKRIEEVLNWGMESKMFLQAYSASLKHDGGGS